MRVVLRLRQNAAVLGELDLLPSNLRRLTKVSYIGEEYDVVNARTTVVNGQPVAYVDVRRARNGSR